MRSNGGEESPEIAYTRSVRARRRTKALMFVDSDEDTENTSPAPLEPAAPWLPFLNGVQSPLNGLKQGLAARLGPGAGMLRSAVLFARKLAWC